MSDNQEKEKGNNNSDGEQKPFRRFKEAEYRPSPDIDPEPPPPRRRSEEPAGNEPPAGNDPPAASEPPADGE